MKLIVLWLSLFLVNHSAFAQMSQKQREYEEKQKKYNELVQQKEDIVKMIERSQNLSEEQMKKINERFKTQEQKIQNLEIEMQKLITEMAKEAVGGIPIQNERQKIEELTRLYWAKMLSWHDYVDQIFGERSTYSLDDRKYALGLWEKKANEKLHKINQKINQCNDEMQIIRYDLIDEVYKMTNFVYKPGITPNNIKTIPNDPYYFSNKINEKVQSQKKPPLQQNTLQNIQQTFNNAAAEHAKVNSEKEKAEKEYDELQEAYNLICKTCPQCCKQE